MKNSCVASGPSTSRRQRKLSGDAARKDNVKEADADNEDKSEPDSSSSSGGDDTQDGYYLTCAVLEAMDAVNAAYFKQDAKMRRFIGIAGAQRMVRQAV